MAITAADRQAFEAAYDEALGGFDAGAEFTAEDERLFSRVDGASRRDCIRHMVATLRAIRAIGLRALRQA